MRLHHYGNARKAASCFIAGIEELTMLRLLNRPPKTLEERYFSEIRPLLYERHATHRQRGVRQERTLAEHLDSACQFVLTVSKLAGVPDDKRAVILGATTVHDLNKLDKSE